MRFPCFSSCRTGSQKMQRFLSLNHSCAEVSSYLIRRGKKIVAVPCECACRHSSPAIAPWFKDKEGCIFCDTVRQEEKQGKRIVDVQGDYYALCPYASRVPYEVWLMHRRHNHLFEQPRPGSNRRQLAALLRRVLRRLE